MVIVNHIAWTETEMGVGPLLIFEKTYQANYYQIISYHKTVGEKRNSSEKKEVVTFFDINKLQMT